MASSTLFMAAERMCAVSTAQDKLDGFDVIITVESPHMTAFD